MLKLNYIAIGMLSIFLNARSCDKTSLNPPKSEDLVFSNEEQQLIERNNLFTLDLFKESLSNMRLGDNILLSPLSVNMAVSMTNNGAVGVTQRSISEALRTKDFSSQQLNAYYHKLLETLPKLDSKTTLEISNSIWYRQGFEILPTFSKINGDYFRATVEGLDFTNGKSLDRINSWVKAQTNGRISTIVDEIPSDMMLYLINAIYFKGSWNEAFDVNKTHKSVFVKSDGTSLQTDFMNIESSFNTFRNSGFMGVELPYHDEKFSMKALMPTNDNSTMDLVNLLKEPQGLKALFSGGSKSKVNLFFPKFKFSYGETLNDELESLGMGIAFTNKADFTAINPSGSLLISEVKHKSFIEVNEEGTEAAAVTSVGVALTSMPIVEEIRFDRPFVFLIQENKSGLILFVGLVNDPAKDVNGD